MIPPSTITRCGCSSAPGCRAGSGAACRGASPRRGARVLRLDRGRRDSRQPQRREAGLQGPAAARAAPRSGSPPTTSPPAACASALDGFAVECRAGEVGMLLTRLRGVVSHQRKPAARPVRARRRLAGDRRPVPRRRRRRPLAGRPRSGALIRTEHGLRRVRSRSSTRSATSTRSTSRSSTASPTPAASRSLAIAAVTAARGPQARRPTRSSRRRSSVLPPDRPTRPRPRRRRDPGHHLVPAEHGGAARGRRSGPGQGVWRLEGDRYVEHEAQAA